jgi:hypothetical protein
LRRPTAPRGPTSYPGHPEMSLVGIQSSFQGPSRGALHARLALADYVANRRFAFFRQRGGDFSFFFLPVNRFFIFSSRRFRQLDEGMDPEVFGLVFAAPFAVGEAESTQRPRLIKKKESGFSFFWEGLGNKAIAAGVCARDPAIDRSQRSRALRIARSFERARERAQRAPRRRTTRRCARGSASAPRPMAAERGSRARAR